MQVVRNTMMHINSMFSGTKQCNSLKSSSTHTQQTHNVFVPDSSIPVFTLQKFTWLK